MEKQKLESKVNESSPKIGEVWRHYKTEGRYEILNIGRMQVKAEGLDMAECVIYKAQSDGLVWVRPLADFVEEIEIKNEAGESEMVQRFSKVI